MTSTWHTRVRKCKEFQFTILNLNVYGSINLNTRTKSNDLLRNMNLLFLGKLMKLF